MLMSLALSTSLWLAELIAPILAFDFGALIIILIIIIMGIASTVAEAKKKEEAEKKRQQRQQRQVLREGRGKEDDEESGWEPVPASPRPASEMADELLRRKAPAERFEEMRAQAREARDRAEAQRDRKAQQSTMAARRREESGEHETTGGFQLGPLEHDDLRRAIVLAEVLGPPVALRDDPSRRDDETPHRLV